MAQCKNFCTWHILDLYMSNETLWAYRKLSKNEFSLYLIWLLELWLQFSWSLKNNIFFADNICIHISRHNIDIHMIKFHVYHIEFKKRTNFISLVSLWIVKTGNRIINTIECIVISVIEILIAYDLNDLVLTQFIDVKSKAHSLITIFSFITHLQHNSSSQGIRKMESLFHFWRGKHNMYTIGQTYDI